MSKHTPGPWVVGWGSGLTGPTTANPNGPFCGGRDWAFLPVSRGTETLAVVPQQKRNDEMEANARLIAAAPDMLAALRALLGWCDEYADGGDSSAHEAARAAIAKAEGREP